MKHPSLGLRVALEHRDLVRRVVDTLRRFPDAAPRFEVAIDGLEREAAARRLAEAPPTLPAGAAPAPPPPPAAPVLPLVVKTDDVTKQAVDAWNQMAARAGLPQATRCAGTRLNQLRARLREWGGLDGWRKALAKVEASPYLRGEVKDWRADIDFLLQPSRFQQVMEGRYDRDRRGGDAGAGLGAVLAGVADALGRDVEPR